MAGLFVDYEQVKIDAVNLIAANETRFQKVDKDMGDRDYSEPNMPLCDIRLKRVLPTALAGREYYVEQTFEIEICTFDLSSRQEAATLRDELLSSVQRIFQQNGHFSAFVDAVMLGPVELETGENIDQGAHAASAVMELIVRLYINA